MMDLPLKIEGPWTPHADWIDKPSLVASCMELPFMKEGLWVVEEEEKRLTAARVKVKNDLVQAARSGTLFAALQPELHAARLKGKTALVESSRTGILRAALYRRRFRLGLVKAAASGVLRAALNAKAVRVKYKVHLIEGARSGVLRKSFQGMNPVPPPLEDIPLPSRFGALSPVEQDAVEPDCSDPCVSVQQMSLDSPRDAVPPQETDIANVPAEPITPAEPPLPLPELAADAGKLCIACGGAGCSLCRKGGDDGLATKAAKACLACGGAGCSLCRARGTGTAGPPRSCLACGGVGCSLCRASATPATREASCLACGGAGCSLCRAGTAASANARPCLACGGAGCSLCRRAGS